MPKQTVLKGGHKGKRSGRLRASGYYKQRFMITEKNRKLKRIRHCKKYPNDLQTKALLQT